ncbi:transcriptional regulator [Bradyrhizobium sp. SSBR45G]|uniref:LysR family transcriptional regulator n=1 Tax=unclassified Bradyrhizobium TaxID=2631580 RepID=UPI002342B226|nr:MULTISPECIES: LysR family transcriptional regulator [unclassified Bradyrhizobium]GLH76650.1 transcriptional regulator [Bradyrhizobium sp. SSBR45G]GLH84263.1 transcriptional regulator [Bradyrhizobium sp. SSBR45R]
MSRSDLVDLNTFVVIAEERSFTRAAARLGTSQSALSHQLRRLETRLGVRLLTRTTRSVAVTLAGENLLDGLRPAFETIDASLAAISVLREKPRGKIRMTVPRHAASSLLWPSLRMFVAKHPEIEIELSVDTALRDLVSDQYDAGVRLGELVMENMIAVPIGPDLRMAAVAAPEYFVRRKIPLTPRDLAKHVCINFRLPRSGRLYAWEFEKRRHQMKVRVNGPLVFDEPDMILAAAVDGQGIAFLMEDQVAEMLEKRRLVRVLEDWCPSFPGYHLYYQTRKNNSAAFRLLIEELRYRK